MRGWLAVLALAACESASSPPPGVAPQKVDPSLALQGDELNQFCRQQSVGVQNSECERFARCEMVGEGCDHQPRCGPADCVGPNCDPPCEPNQGCDPYLVCRGKR
jgi:hypothetical protein